MKKIILKEREYTFDASERTITVLEKHEENFTEEFLMLITNVTANQPIYVAQCIGFGGSINFLTITLEFDTTSMNDTDTLQIILFTEVTSVDAETIELMTIQNDQLACLQNILTQGQLTNQYLKELNNG